MVHTCTVQSDGCRDWGCQPKPRDCCSERDLIAMVVDRVGVAAGGKKNGGGGAKWWGKWCDCSCGKVGKSGETWWV